MDSSECFIPYKKTYRGFERFDDVNVVGACYGSNGVVGEVIVHV